MKYGTESSETTTVGGVSEDYFTIEVLELSEGRKLQYMDMKNRQQVCLIGAYLAKEWFNGSPIGEEISIAGYPFTVVGVIKQTGDSEPRARTNDDRVIIPYSTAAAINGSRQVSQFFLTSQPEVSPERARVSLENELLDILGDKDWFYVSSMAEMLKEMDSMISVVSTVLTIIAAISLLVGGIGIMNIMLVSVTERTREIGIRKALGAKERYIMQQFVIEAGVTSGLGGVIGILFGFLLSAGATALIKSLLQTQMTIVPALESVMMAFGISVFIGVLFGYLPAKKAARLNPIDALHFD